MEGRDKHPIQCFKCKEYGHKKSNCPMPDKKTEPEQVYERLKWSFEDPMKHYMDERQRNIRQEKEERVQKLKELIECTSSESEEELANERKKKKRKNKRHHSSSSENELKIHRKKKKSKHKVKRLKSDKICSSEKYNTEHKSKHRHKHKKHKSKH